jgi:hypothetical protein
MKTEWTTRWPAELTQVFGIAEAHQAGFEPVGWPGHGASVILSVPECELTIGLLAPDGDPTFLVNRPTHNRNVKQWTRFACEAAVQHQALLVFCCNTPQEAERAARLAAKLLPRHQRMSLERMLAADPKDRARSNLS